jgi:Domain of unknown function (DUF4132)
MFGKLTNAIFGKRTEVPANVAVPAAVRSVSSASVPTVPRVGSSKPLPALGNLPVSVALYPGKRDDGLFLEWIDAVSVHFRLMREQNTGCEGLISKWLFNTKYGASNDLAETNRMLFGSALEPAWVKGAWSVIRSLQPKGVGFGNHISQEIITGKKKLLTRFEAEKLLKLFDREPLVVETWNAPSPPRAALLRFEALDDPDALRRHLSSASSASPSGAWEKSALGLGKDAGLEIVRERLEQWLCALTDKSPSPKEIRDWSLLWHIGYQMELLQRLRGMGVSPAQAAPLAFLEHDFDPIGPVTIPDMGNPFSASNGQPMVMSKENANLARGAVWLLAGIGKTAPQQFERVALISLTKYDLGGTYNSRQFCSQALANACILALGRDGSSESILALGRIRRKIRDARIAAQVDKTMQAAAAAVGMAAVDLEETAVPDFDIGPEGWTESLDGNQLTLEIDAGGAHLVCVSSSGKALKSLPASVKSSEACKEMKAAAEEIDALLPLIRWRLEASWLGHRSWSLEIWRERYGEHPLARALAAPLIWWIETNGKMTSGMWRDGSFFDIKGLAIAVEGASIRLWHPISDTLANVQAWRQFLVSNRIRQPFKQAHREVYALTDAERTTATFSNRFAAHILRQHQYMSLAKARGWTCRHRMWQDTPNDEPTKINLPAFGLWAEIFIEGAGGDDPEVLDSTAYVYVNTDQVRFHSLGEPGQTPLENVPPLVFSEVMRDCDLFVGVASIGADPNWINRGADAHRPNQWHRDTDRYWHEASFGELAESAKLRKELIAEILPSLPIADKCEIKDRFLRVQGKLRAYRIHFNSGNILMEPDDRYLCIVPGSGEASPDIFIPFDGDRTFSVILSKALMLADDSKIKDQAIFRQIQ